MHRLLKRQLTRIFGRDFDINTFSDEQKQFIEKVDETYAENDSERKFLENTLEINSTELNSANAEIKKQNDSLNELVEERTQSLREALIKAEQATLAKSDFLANMSHEIRTPLNGITGMIHLTLQTQLNEVQKEYLDKINSSAELLLGIINDILDFSKIEANKVELEEITFEIKQVVDNVINLTQLKAEEKAILFKIEVEDAVPALLKGDPLRIGQVLINLTNNAVKFSQSGDSVEVNISLKEQEDKQITLLCSVRDTGIGMSSEQQEKLFKPFSQTDSSTTRKYGGTGLGLAISKRLIEMMEGQIWVESQEGVGSTFYFSIPLQKGKNETLTQHHDYNESQLEEAIARLKNKKILLAEDNQVNQLVAKKLLAHYDIQVVIAENGQQALLALEKETFDGVLMDCMMPILDGYETTRQIRLQKQYASLPVIAMTANAMKHDIENVLACGMNDHIAKPVNPKTMLMTMAKWIG
ncbi:hypothetical protein THMIRHAM_21690 [Thiomicrorhabdus immobilis]|uniref:histidine kinase n=1 Tax=Thiomicrorhabdus immobilis TaxID=2791037 RepID=A0ABN6D321_9GAMM|nr:ATP-binding protein [Thiomicrorhabdus immobilis]BCN94384.1 hypothetical protein THMIRHAM_21690 [Thiomicrorhabdus immobilis]